MQMWRENFNCILMHFYYYDNVKKTSSEMVYLDIALVLDVQCQINNNALKDQVKWI